ncbi:MAG: hypothetical protein AAF353_06370 [Pseudomonadota bacterium]
MNQTLLILSLSYVFLAAVLLLVIHKSNLQLSFKMLLLVFSVGFFWVHFESMKSSMGWPVSDTLPVSFELIEGVVVEPNVREAEPGYVYIWIRDLAEADSLPRAYRLPYGEQLHQRIDEVIKAQGRGKRYAGKPGSGIGDKATGPIEFDLLERSRPVKQ